MSSGAVPFISTTIPHKPFHLILPCRTTVQRYPLKLNSVCRTGKPPQTWGHTRSMCDNIWMGATIPVRTCTSTTGHYPCQIPSTIPSFTDLWSWRNITRPYFIRNAGGIGCSTIMREASSILLSSINSTTSTQESRMGWCASWLSNWQSTSWTQGEALEASKRWIHIPGNEHTNTISNIPMYALSILPTKRQNQNSLPNDLGPFSSDSHDTPIAKLLEA